MSVKKYGIYLAYPPTVDLRHEGLGRHLAMFLKGAGNLKGVQFTIICPSWSKETLYSLFESEQVPLNVFSIVAPQGKPYILRAYEAIKRFKERPRRVGLFSHIVESISQRARRLWLRWVARAVAVHNISTLSIYLLELMVGLFVLIPAVASLILFVLIFFATKFVGSLFFRFYRVLANRLRNSIGRVLLSFVKPEQEGWVLRLYDLMQRAEIVRMQKKIQSLKNIRAWYCPTAFWPSFNEIKGARLICVPDVVLADFPSGFSSVGGDRFLEIYETIGKTIRSSEYFATYSHSVKWRTLIERYGVEPEKISVIPHAPNLLNNRIDIVGFPDQRATIRNYCQTLLRGAMQRSTNVGYTSGFQNLDVKYLFYASQLRPNKNIITLLRAYNYLLRTRYLGCKLILTGHPGDMTNVMQFVTENRLEKDVIFMHGLSVSELAACYKLAELAVNPTLSEGGCPFTFTEALSVGTPVVMSRIAVAEEVLTDPGLQDVTLFNPYDWRDCANRIEWALNNREELLCIQQSFYEILAKRTWTDVVAEHVELLDMISDKEQVEHVS